VFTNDYLGELEIPRFDYPITWKGFLLEIFKDLEKILKFKIKLVKSTDSDLIQLR
jgi:hypothetical protein